ncbi:MAG: hypothetical protein A3K19_11180 [Lentisphaerae bacterium RIFOXYB12_FULL_65_16]|nr:MAG: hypothetical protein A3K18_06700 [Lentisphaerae bacterium RIFOXYA12_64_32]OGV91658.1 MAG: hypothetical protein A3K19_11180 [Lentisphaerae bacterium RIFOXYB12_FULL_65_16]
MNLRDLNEPQRQAVCTVDGPLLLLAGAGTGKTRVITSRIAYLVSRGIAPGNILAVTFTNKAAREMKERVAKLLSADAARAVTVGTFHSFCARLLRKKIHLLGYRPNFAIASEAYRAGLIRTLMAELGLTGEGRDPASWLATISKAKGALSGPDELGARDDLPHAGAIAEVYALYDRRMKQMNLVDFDDLLGLVLKLWEEKPDALAEHRNQYHYLLIDEYQDTNRVQFQLMATLAGERRNLCVVGDDDQSIYAWRGADITNILEFERHFPSARVITLEQNYRSTTTILDAAGQVIANNRARRPKRLWSTRGAGNKIQAVRVGDDEEEARFVVDLLREHRLHPGMTYGQCAVLFRSNHLSRALENQFRQSRLPYVLVGTRSFFERKEILDVVSLLQAVDNPDDDLSLLRILNVPPRGIGDKAVERLRHWQRVTNLPLQQLLAESEFLAELPPATAASVRAFHRCLMDARTRFETPGHLTQNLLGLLEDSGYLEGLGRMYKPREDALRRRDNVLEFVNEMAEYVRRAGAAATLRDFLESFALLDTNDREEKDSAAEDAVTLMTVHAAKGLEFTLVCVVGMERGLFPHQRALEEHAEDEERRLFYVALTRARQDAVLTYAETRRIRGDMVRRRPSPFLDEIPPELVEFTTPAKSLKPASPEVAANYLAQMKAQFAPKKNAAGVGPLPPSTAIDRDRPQR